MEIMTIEEINKAIEEFESEKVEPKDLKMVIDFEQIDLTFEGKQMDLGSIKYKKKKNTKLKKAIVNLKENKKGKNLF